MSRITRGALALAAATVLCLGGAGSMAYWQDSAATDAAAFTMGELALDPVGTGEWTVGGEAVASAYRAAPGDTLVFTQDFALVKEGDGLQAGLTLSPGAIVATPETFTAGEATLTGPVASTGPNEWTVTGSGTVSLSLAFTWSKGAAVDNSTQGAVITIDPTTLLIQQEVVS